VYRVSNKSKKPRKRGPKKERQVIADPHATREELLKSAKDRFDAAHADGLKALNDCDYAAFGEAIERERKIIDELGGGRRLLSKPKKP
jgi:hypothetical protein